MTGPVEFGLATFGDITAGAGGDEAPRLSHAEVIRNVVTQGVLADCLGIDFFGVGEHHRADFAVSAPEVVLAAIAGQTRRIRLGSAATVLSADDPVRVFERFATLHALSNGRAEVILGRGWFTEPFALFGHDVGRYAALFEEKLEIFARLLRTGRGKTVFPPIEGGPLRTWIAVGATPDSVLRAAHHGLPMMLAVIGGEPARFRPLVELYRQAFEKTGRSAQAVGAHAPGYVADTDARAREEFWPSYKRLRDRIGADRGWPPIERRTFDMEADRGSLFVGAPATVAAKIRATIDALGLARFDLKFSAGDLAHDRLMQSITLYGSDVVPQLRPVEVPALA